MIRYLIRFSFVTPTVEIAFALLQTSKRIFSTPQLYILKMINGGVCT